MEDKKARILSIISIIVTVLGLSLGFAAYSTTLTIKSSAEVAPDEDIFNVDFSKNSDIVSDDNIAPVLSPTGVEGFTATDAVIDNTGSDPVIKNLHAKFTKPGQKATYTFYTKNSGGLKAYLKSITFANISGKEVTKVCTAKNASTTTEALVNEACQGITLKLTLGSSDYTSTKLRTDFGNIHDLDVDASETIKVTISYEEGSAQADGGFDVAFGDIILVYSSAA